MKDLSVDDLGLTVLPLVLSEDNLKLLLTGNDCVFENIKFWKKFIIWRVSKLEKKEKKVNNNFKSKFDHKFKKNIRNTLQAYKCF
jgi:hypothetical protein